MASASTSSSSLLNPSIQGLANRSHDSHDPGGAAAVTPSTVCDAPSAPPLADAQPQCAAGAATKSEDSASDNAFMCNICLSQPTQAVATYCGHVYCWGCLYKWLAVPNHSNDPACPVCKAVIEMPNLDPSKAKVIPLYVNGKSEADPRTTVPEDAIPSRPQSERPPQQQQQQSQRNFTFAFDGHASMASGLGLLPSLIGLTYLPTTPLHTQMNQNGNAGAPGGAQGTVSQDEAAQQEFLSRVLFMIGTFIALCLIFFP